MGKNKATAKTDTPKWWNVPPRMAQVRNIEDAFRDILVGNQTDLANWHKDDVDFSELLVHLGMIDDRWKDVKSSDFVPNKHACFKGLWSIFNRLRSNPKKLKELMDIQDEEDDENDANEVPSKLIPEI